MKFIKDCCYLSCPSATFALQHGGFVPREWLAAKGLFTIFTEIDHNAPCLTAKTFAKLFGGGGEGGGREGGLTRNIVVYVKPINITSCCLVRQISILGNRL